MDGGDDWHGLFGHIDAGEDLGGFGDTWKPFVEDFRWEMVKMQVDVVFLFAYSTSLQDFHGHGTTDDVSRGQIQGGGCVSAHKALTKGIT